MPKITCLCGEAINLSQIPSPQGFKIVSEKVFDTLVEKLVNAYANSPSKTEFEKQAYGNFYPTTHGIAQAYECPACGRLVVFSHPSDAIPALWFQPEKANTKTEGSIRALMNEETGD